MSPPNDTVPGLRPGFESPPSQDERTWGMLSHLAAFVGLLIPCLGAILAPLILWLVWRDRSPFVADQAKEALNFNISVALAGLVCALLTVVFIGILLGIVLFFGWLALTILAAIRASEGMQYRYPLNLRLVK
jgi:uncharacterized protein